MTEGAKGGDALRALAERVETEEPSYGLWQPIFARVSPMPERTGAMSGSDWQSRWNKYRRFCEVGAYRDAAAILQPATWQLDQAFDIMRGETTTVMLYHDHLTDKEGGVANQPHAFARAHLAACLRARAALLDGGARDGGENG